MWYGVDVQGSSHKWYAGTTLISTLDGYGNLSVIAGFLANATYSGSYTDGTVVDYQTGNGRISVGSNDKLSFYTGGIGSTTMSVFATNSITFYQPTTVSGTLTSGTISVTGNVVATGTMTASAVNAALYQINGIKALNGPAFSAYGSVVTSLPNGISTKIVLDSEEFDTDSVFDSTNYRFAPPIPGYYQFNAHVSVVTYANSTNTSQIITIYKNGSEYKRGVRTPVNTQGVGTQISTMIFMDGIVDYIELYVLQGSGATVSTEVGSSYGPWLQGNFVKPSANNYVYLQYLVIGGGAGGGCNWGGGGGGGGYVEGASGFIKGYTYSIIVGSGGLGATIGGSGANGGSSSITGGKITTTNVLTIIANGGGGGGYNISGSTAQVGNSNGNGSGGGAGYPGSGGTVAGGSGAYIPNIIDFSTTLYYNSGGQSQGLSTRAAGGGGGASSGGTEGQTTRAGGNGGAGKSSVISGTLTYYSAGGGGGGDSATTQSSGGTGNTGGKGGNTNAGAGTNGAGGYGMGGGGGATNGGAGGNGTAGVVIIRVLSVQVGTATGTYATLVDGSWTVITFTGNGTYTP
jgi:hypothetical protein